MQPILYLAEIIFFVLFVATLAEYLHRRDPVSRDVMLSFSALAVLFVVSLWKDLGGGAPDAISGVAGGLFILQPVFTLHLVSLIRRVPPRLFWAGTLLLVATGLPVVALQIENPILTAGAAIAFIGLQSAAAVYLLLEAGRRKGPSAARMALAAGATGIFAAALLVSMAGNAASQSAAGTVAASVLAVVAGLGYLCAFLPPAPIREIWQARTTVEYTRNLIGRSREPVPAIWAEFTQMAVRMQAGSAIMITGVSPGEPSVVATAGVDDAAARAVQIGWAELDGLTRDARSRWDVPVAQAGPIRQRLAEVSGARFVSVVPIALPDRAESAALVLLSEHRALFHATDLELLGALGAQTAIVAERRAVMAEQEELTERLKLTVEALRSASAAKSDFVASMSHEFRTPLSAILGFSELMASEPRDGETVKVPIEWVEHIHRGGQHLLALVNDVLDLARVEAGRLDLRPELIDVGSAVTEAVSGLRPLADRKAIAIEASVPAMIVAADRGRFRQILYNLISNAIKYTPDGGIIRVAAVQTAGEVRIAVVDNGIGIDPTDHASVFEQFRQVGDPHDRQPGSGLGLAVTKRLAEAHDGRVELESARGQGSTFTLVLPASADDLAAPPDAVAASAAASALGDAIVAGDVLVVEDDPSAVRLLREYLEAAGYSVRVAPTGEAGLAAVAERAPAAVVLDVLLPGIDGWEVLRRLKADDRTHSIPVIIVTVVEEREVGLALGAADYLVKPIHRSALLNCLARYVATGAAGGAARRVLVVDDEAAALSLIRAALEPEGYEVVTAQGGRAALEWVRRGQLVDLVVCDLVMPEVDGFEVIAALKRERRTSAVPIVVCTAHDLTLEQKARLNGQILGIVAKGQDARLGLLDWLSRSAPGRAN
ncbi:MAG TPA: response regulator [Candidatus Limnocylindrales bacterium]|nr:response regulator [Candidatus Limnocylindrales bacterium]